MIWSQFRSGNPDFRPWTYQLLTRVDSKPTVRNALSIKVSVSSSVIGKWCSVECEVLSPAPGSLRSGGCTFPLRTLHCVSVLLAFKCSQLTLPPSPRFSVALYKLITSGVKMCGRALFCELLTVSVCLLVCGTWAPYGSLISLVGYTARRRRSLCSVSFYWNYCGILDKSAWNLVSLCKAGQRILTFSGYVGEEIEIHPSCHGHLTHGSWKLLLIRLLPSFSKLRMNDAPCVLSGEPLYTRFS